MAETTAEEYFPQDTFHAQWAVFWLLAIALGVYLWLSYFRPPPFIEPPRAAISAGYDWFLVLHMPEVPNNKERAAAVRASYAGWLEALAREGYHPMLLSDVEQRMERGVGLPERAVVLVFEPAYFRTYDALSPVFLQYRFPALWVSDHTALLRGDRHFIHQHQEKAMRRSGYWDMGYSGDGFWGFKSDPNKMLINNNRSVTWAPGAGHEARNWGSDLPLLKRLDVSPKWSPEELIMRLEMELPLEGTVRLGAKSIQDQLWGLLMTSSQKSNLFSLQAPLNATEANIYWLGTRGAQDVQLDVNIPSFFGQASLWLRSDRKTGQGVGVGFTHQQIYVDQKIRGVTHRLVSAPWPSPSGAIKGRIILSGSTLNVAIEGAQPIRVELTPMTPAPTAMVRLGVFDRVRGAARLEFVNLSLTPLSKIPH